MTDLVHQAPATGYARIVEHLTSMIDSGELEAGERIPSTRALATQYGVALATATRAVAELRRSGLIRSQARVGSVVVPRRARAELTRERVVQAGIEIADAEGLEAVSMRAVAARLGASTMALYRYLPSKERLIMLMADAVHGEDDYPKLPTRWREQVELAARTLWRLYGRHPWLAHLGPLGRPLLLPNLARHGEVLLTALNRLGLPAGRVLDLQILIYSHGLGLAVNLEREIVARTDSGLDDEQWLDRRSPQVRSLADRFPEFARMINGLPDGGYDFDLDALFELGLQALLDGIERMVPTVMTR